jgi:hypothetical protein
MLVIVGGRQTGKTHQLVEWVTDRPNRTILCADVTRADRLRRDYGLSADQVRLPDNLGTLGTQKEVAIDDAETLLRTFIKPGDTLGAISLTGPDDFLGHTTDDQEAWLRTETNEPLEPLRALIRGNECHGFGG